MLALSLAFLGGIDTGPRVDPGNAFEPTPIAHVETAPSYRLDVGVLRFDTGAHIASDFGAALYDLDGALDASARLGDDNLSLTFVGALSMDRTRGPFVLIDAAPHVARVDGSWTPGAQAGARLHLDMDDVETSHAWTSGIEATHDAATLAPFVRSHVAHRADSDVRVSFATLTDDKELRAWSAIVAGSAAHHAFTDDKEVRAFAWGGPGFAYDGDIVDAHAWCGPSLDAALAFDVAGALELAFDLDARTVLARFERRPLASPFHARASVSSASLAMTTGLALLELGASASGAFIDVDDERADGRADGREDGREDGRDGLRADVVVEARWPFEVVTAIARVVVEACAFGPVRVARGAFVVGIEL